MLNSGAGFGATCRGTARFTLCTDPGRASASGYGFDEAVLLAGGSPAEGIAAAAAEGLSPRGPSRAAAGGPAPRHLQRMCRVLVRPTARVALHDAYQCAYVGSRVGVRSLASQLARSVPQNPATLRFPSTRAACERRQGVNGVEFHVLENGQTVDSSMCVCVVRRPGQAVVPIAVL
jgi:hypothetical protein